MRRNNKRSNKENNKNKEVVTMRSNKENNKNCEAILSGSVSIFNWTEAEEHHKIKTITLKELMEEDEEEKALYEKYMTELDEEKAEDEKKDTKKRSKEKAKQQKINKPNHDPIMAPAVIENESSSTDSDSDTNVIVEVKEENMESLLDIVEDNVTRKVRKKINKIINKYLPQNVKRKYVTMGDGLYKIYIVSQDGRELIENIIDPFGTMTGGTNPSVYKKGLNPSGSPEFKMVNLTRDKKLSAKLLSTKSFVDTKFFISFESDFIDPNIDLSKTEIIDKFDESKEQSFMGNIYSCLNLLANAGIQVPRFRFFDLKSENQFTLISDFECKVPLKYESIEINGVKNTLNINGYIDNGRVIEFNNGTITTYYAGNKNNQLILANQQSQQQQQPVTQQQMMNNAINNNMANGFMMQQPLPVIR